MYPPGGRPTAPAGRAHMLAGRAHTLADSACTGSALCIVRWSVGFSVPC